MCRRAATPSSTWAAVRGTDLARLHAHLAAQCLAYDVSFVGVDVSVAATRLTAGRLGGVATAVVDVHDSLYIRDRAATVIVNVFAPRNGDEFARILAPAGLCLVIVPEADHLREVRQRFKLLDIPGGKAHRVQRQFAPELRLQSEYRIRASARFDSSALEALVRMTPNAWHLTPDRVTAIRRVSSMDSTISCVLLCFTRETQRERRRTERVSRVLRRTRVASLGPSVATRTATMSHESIRLSEYPFTDSFSRRLERFGHCAHQTGRVGGRAHRLIGSSTRITRASPSSAVVVLATAIGSTLGRLVVDQKRAT